MGIPGHRPVRAEWHADGAVLVTVPAD
jgi:hypothetical protein